MWNLHLFKNIILLYQCHPLLWKVILKKWSYFMQFTSWFIFFLLLTVIIISPELLQKSLIHLYLDVLLCTKKQDVILKANLYISGNDIYIYSIFWTKLEFLVLLSYFRIRKKNYQTHSIKFRIPIVWLKTLLKMFS